VLSDERGQLGTRRSRVFGSEKSKPTTRAAAATTAHATTKPSPGSGNTSTGARRRVGTDLARLSTQASSAALPTQLAT
jgi:hypothetical protein